MGLHDGHRQRMKERFARHGLDSFAEHEALELLLYYAIPRRDTNELAHTLLDRFGSLERVLLAPREELMKVPGVGEGAALLLTRVPAVSQYTHRHAPQETILNSGDASGISCVCCATSGGSFCIRPVSTGRASSSAAGVSPRAG